MKLIGKKSNDNRKRQNRTKEIYNKGKIQKRKKTEEKNRREDSKYLQKYMQKKTINSTTQYECLVCCIGLVWIFAQNTDFAAQLLCFPQNRLQMKLWLVSILAEDGEKIFLPDPISNKLYKIWIVTLISHLLTFDCKISF